MSHPIVLYVPGLLPKPQPDAHRNALFECLVAGLRRVDSDVAAQFAATSGAFDIVAWTYEFYQQQRDIGLDREAIASVMQQPTAKEKDIAEATSWLRRLTRWLYQLGDMLPFLIPHLASERMEVHLRDLRRYTRNENDIAERIRSALKISLLAAYGGQHPILVIGHSMGSVIAYDTLWELSHKHSNPPQIDLLLTMGSPLGQRYIQRRLLGSRDTAERRYPSNIKRWKNLSAIGDLTAIDPWLANDFGEMLKLGLVDRIEDEVILNYYRLNDELNVHSEYGYLVNDKTARIVADWWRTHDSAMPSRP